MKLRLMPLLVTVVASSVILFGGWFVYHTYAMENPLSAIASQEKGVDSVTADLNGTQAVFHLKLGSDVDLRELYAKISADGAKTIGTRDVVLDATSDSTPELEAWWSNALFDVAQAMETRHYADIPASLAAKTANQSGLHVQTEMDDKNVYVRLTDGTHTKYVILPRVPTRMGVWPNE